MVEPVWARADNRDRGETGANAAEDTRDVVGRHMPEQELAALRAVRESERDGLWAAPSLWAHRQDSENLLE